MSTIDLTKLLTAADALQPQPPTPWIVEDLLVASGLSIFFGESGAKKTWMALDLACAVASGQPWLALSVTPTPVLIIDEESGRRRFLARLGDTLRGHDLDGVTPIFATNMEAYNFTKPEDVNSVAAYINAIGARLCIIDSLAAVFGGADENAVAEVQPIMSALRLVAERNDCHISLLHHANRLGAYRGSSALKAAVDLLLLVHSEQSSLDIKFTVEKSRDFEPRTFGARANWEPGQFWLSAQNLTVEESMPRSQAFVLHYLEQHNRASVKSIEEAADVCSSRTARNAVYTLASRGKIRRVDSGGRGAEALYELAAGRDGTGDE